MGSIYSDHKPPNRHLEEERAHAAMETIRMENEDFRMRLKRTMSNERKLMTIQVAESEAQFRQQADSLEKMYLQQLEGEKGEMAKKMDALQNESRQECKRMAEERAELMVQTNAARAECERLAAEKIEMFRKMTEFRELCERMMKEGEVEAAKKQESLAKELEMSREEMAKRMAEEKAVAERASADMARKMAEEKAKAEHLAKSREEMAKALAEEKAAAERASAEMARKMAEEKEAHERASAEMARLMAEEIVKAEHLAKSREEMSKKLAEETAAAVAAREEMAKSMAEEKANAERLAKSRKEMAKKMAEEKAAAELASAAMAEKMAKERAMAEAASVEMARKMKEEKADASRKLTEFRKQKEAQLRTERQANADIMQCLRELPPLQSAMELGDLRKLEEEMQKWSAGALPERFGDCKGVVEAVVKLARERLLTWHGVRNTVQEIVKESGQESERKGRNVQAFYERCHRLFRSMKEAQLTKLDISLSDPDILQKICEVFYTWQERAMSFPNKVQKSIVHKVVNCKELGAFLFVDMDTCLQLVDRSSDGNEIFLSRARMIVEDENTKPTDLKRLLAHIETMLFFLKYAKSEDLSLTHAEFGKYISSGTLTPCVARQLEWALSAYPPGSELARLSKDRSLTNAKDVSAVLEEIRVAPGGSKDSLGFFREIFFHWAVAMRSKFDLLVLPHHTQVICLLAFRRFLEEEEARQTTEAPHALVALVGTGEGKSMIIAILAIYIVVVLQKKVHIVIDDESLLERDFYTFKPLFDAFKIPKWKGLSRRPIKAMLCVREERLVGERHRSLAPRIDPQADICYCEGKHVQSFYASIARDSSCDFDGYADRILIVDEVDALVIDQEPNEAFVYPNQELSEMATYVAGALKKGARAEDAMKNTSHPAAARLVREMSVEWAAGMNLVSGEDFVYVKEVGRYCPLHAGRANPNEFSLALECRNFQDGHSPSILFQERLFVMSRPRVFRKYHRLLGVSGSIGSNAERKFLQETYKADFFEVPPFLKTCKGSPFHAAVPAQLGVKKQAVYVEPTPEAQLNRLAEVALEARQKVPVLVIAKDRSTAEHFVENLQALARARGLGSTSEDAVRSLSRKCYEADPEQWKENLNRATMPMGDGRLGSTWRITVTDPRGGRGTDYRVDNADVDARGGLLLIPTIVPGSHREWVQFLGRTARQDRKGQFCAVLCATDYAELGLKNRKLLKGGNDLTAVNTILSWGDRECTERIQGSAALYNCGVRMNELCEEIFGRRAKLLEDLHAREALVKICQSFRYMSVREIDEAFAQIPGFMPAEVPTEACDLGPAAEPQSSYTVNRLRSARRPATPREPAPKMVVLCLDCSTSMLSRDTGTALNRFETCIKCVHRILADQVKECDVVGIVGFGAEVKTVVRPTVKGSALARINQDLRRLAPSMSGGTCFFDAVSACLQSMGQEAVAPLQWPRWLVCLTDGDDVGSKRENARGQEVTRVLDAGAVKNLNMVVITVGKLKDENTKVIDVWVEKVRMSGGLGRHVSEKDAAGIVMAFDEVAECLAADLGGAVEC